MSPICGVFEDCERDGIVYCVLRDAEDAQVLADGGEVDLLVAPSEFDALARVLTARGFVPIEAWGRAPHRFFVTYDSAHDRWIKCDVVTEVRFGRPIHSLRSSLAEPCLARRRRVGATYAPEVEEELIALLLHEMLDKRSPRPHRISRLKELRAQVTHPERLELHLRACWPGMTWSRLSHAIDADHWDSLMAERSRVAAMLKRADRVGTAVREVRDRIARTAHRTVGLLSPHAPSLALLAPDGAGKSTLVAGIEHRFFGPASSIYMGLYQKSRSKSGRTPGLGLLSLLVTQWRRFFRARSRQANGQLVLFDRYSYDALLPGRAPLNLARRLRRWLLAWTVPGPDLTVVLDAPGEMLFARKGEHSVDILERQRQAYLGLASRLPRAHVVNAQQHADDVRRDVTRLVWNEYQRRSR